MSRELAVKSREIQEAYRKVDIYKLRLEDHFMNSRDQEASLKSS
jgi:hypothetical protein